MTKLGTPEWCEEVCKSLNDSEGFKVAVDRMGQMLGLEEGQVVITVEDMPLNIVFDLTRKGCRAVNIVEKADEIKEPVVQLTSNLETWVSALIKSDQPLLCYLTQLRACYDREIKVAKLLGKDPTPETLKALFSITGVNFFQQLVWALKNVKTDLA